MNNKLLSKQSKVIVDVLLVIGFFVSVICSKMDSFTGNYWQSLHCITGILWFLLIGIHVMQNWRFIKAFTKKKVILKNKITALTILCFGLMLVSILSFIGILFLPWLHYHHVIGRLFVLMILIHTIDKSKRFVKLLKK